MLIAMYNRVQGTRGAFNSNLQVAITHARQV